jgi:hypothetical protein
VTNLVVARCIWVKLMATNEESLNHRIVVPASIGAKVRWPGSNRKVAISPDCLALGWSTARFPNYAMDEVLMRMGRQSTTARTDK